jgi:hypothetical protein
MVMFSGQGEGARMPSHAAHRSPHHTPHPLITKNHPAHAQHAKARQHSAHKARSKKRGTGTHHRATVVAAANPATVRLHATDTTALWPLAQHVNVNTLTVGGAVVGIVFDPSDPNDALLTGVY